MKSSPKILYLRVIMKELTNSVRQLVAALDETKYRKREKKFKAEGTKCVRDTIEHFKLSALLATEDWLNGNSIPNDSNITLCSPGDMRKMSSLTTPPGVIAVYEIPAAGPMPTDDSNNLMLALDAIRDPGNLGTIIRIADWFGIHHILASTDTTDCYSPKVVQATMGSISRVRVHYTDLCAALFKRGDVYGTYLDGDSIYDVIGNTGTNRGVIVIGNESRGISEAVSRHVNHRITIPSYPPDAPTGESLNAAVATAIAVAAFRRNSL